MPTPDAQRLMVKIKHAGSQYGLSVRSGRAVIYRNEQCLGPASVDEDAQLVECPVPVPRRVRSALNRSLFVASVAVMLKHE